MEKERFFYKFEDYMGEGFEYIMIISEKDFIENKGQFLGIEQGPLIDFLYKHGIAQAEENIFDNSSDLTEKDFVALFEKTQYEFVLNEKIY